MQGSVNLRDTPLVTGFDDKISGDSWTNYQQTTKEESSKLELLKKAIRARKATSLLI